VREGLRGRVVEWEDGDMARCRLVPHAKVNEHLLKVDFYGPKVTFESFKKDWIVRTDLKVTFNQ